MEGITGRKTRSLEVLKGRGLAKMQAPFPLIVAGRGFESLTFCQL
jgi:hypothetical protein